MEFSIEVTDAKAVSLKKLQQAAEEVRKKMMQLAYQNLSPETAAIYTMALTPVRLIGTEAVFELEGWLAKSLEEGVDPFDMKPGMLRSHKAQVSKTGSTFLRVPIRDKEEGKLSIRTVSSRSKPGSWIHPGLTGRHFWEQAKIEWSKK